MIEIHNLSTQYRVRRLDENDINLIFDLCKENDIFYQYHPPFVTRESIREDMKALPSGKGYEDKYYIGYFNDGRLVAVMDLILRHPQDTTAFIGFFMMARSLQGQGAGSRIISDCAVYLKKIGYEKIRLGIDKGNPQSTAFWAKNFFVNTGEETIHGTQTVMFAERKLMAQLSFRSADRNDVSLILEFIKELADYEKMLDEVVATEELLTEWIFEKNKAEVIFVLEDGKEVGFALFFHNFSTFLGRAGIYLEDLFVKPEYRGKGYGKAILKKLAAIAVERGCGRLEWSCLDWNQPSIDFYLSLGAKPMDEWTVYRVTGDTLKELAETSE